MELNKENIIEIFDRIFKIYSHKDIQKIIESIIKTLSYVSEVRDPYTCGHQKRVADLSFTIAKKMNLDDERLQNLYLASYIHDIGKIRIPNEILMRPTKLITYEFSLIKCHAEVGFDILNQIKYLKEIPKIVLQHHERLDGSGYPFGLTKNKIKIEAKILAVSDVVEAIANDRPYRKALGINVALKELEDNKNKLYDKEVCDNCISIISNGYNIRNN